MRTAPARTHRPLTGTRPKLWAAAVGLAAVGLLVSACGSQSTPAAAGGSSTPAASSATPLVTAGALVGTVTTPLGTILVGANGRVLYAFAADKPGTSNCTGSCLTYWLPVVAPATLPAGPAGVSATLGVIMRADGTHQLTVNGWPAYTYTGDSSPGTTNGQGKNLNGGLWWILSPAGTQIKSSGTSSTPAPSASKSSAGGGWA